MTKIALLFLVLLAGVLSGYSQKIIPVVQPTVEFDFKQATDMLNTGTSEIKGYCYYEERTPLGIKVGETIYARPGTIVSLYPLTAYLQEYLDLKKKYRKGKKFATISSVASSFRIETKVYSLKGEFAFLGLNAGKYYIESTVYFPSGIGGTEVSGIVEIKKDGDAVDCKLKHIY
jgi:hypothetical protein